MAEILIFLRRQKVQQLTRLARSTICKRVVTIQLKEAEKVLDRILPHFC